MLPDADDPPAKGAEFLEVASVTLPIGPELLSPEGRQLMLPSGQSPTMPEVTVYEDRNLLSREYDIR